VSPERVREELEAAFAKPGGGRALAILVDLGLLERAVPTLAPLAAEEGGLQAYWNARAGTFEHLPPAPGLALGLAALLEGPGERALSVVRSLRPSRELLTEVAEILEVVRAAPAIEGAARSARVRWMRSRAFEAGVALARARRLAAGQRVADLDEAIEERARLGADGLRPAALVTADDVARLGLPPGPAFGVLLREAETRQLDGRDGTREEALAWLAEAARTAAQDGGKTPRSAKEIG
jgi:tRNA nucleotidyltransferase/poly(A) polymerase